MHKATPNNVFKPFDYYPFGMIIPGRSYSANSSYRFGFSGKEKIDEIEGVGNIIDFGARLYSPRLGKLFSPDPLLLNLHRQIAILARGLYLLAWKCRKILSTNKIL